MQHVKHMLKWIKSMVNRWYDWRVVYKDGKRSRRIRREEAYNLQAVHGGKVIYDPF